VKPVRSLLLLLFVLASCGRETELKPPPGKPLPVRPAMARATPTADQLLTRPPEARPDQVGELIKRSVPRRSDPFDMPPPAGGPAPSLTTQPDPQAPTNTTSPNPGE
jgi:hypothetical protein